jgi:hypothetical protein
MLSPFIATAQVHNGEGRQDVMAEQQKDPPGPVKCAHPSCECKVPARTKFCSDYCKKAPETELHCNCMHRECHL